MSASPIPAPDWFDVLWQANAHKLPLMLRGDAVKKLAREMMNTVLDGAGTYAKTPDGIKTVLAFGKIARAVKSMEGAINSPDPSPDEVAAAVERMVERMKGR